MFRAWNLTPFCSFDCYFAALDWTWRILKNIVHGVLVADNEITFVIRFSLAFGLIHMSSEFSATNLIVFYLCYVNQWISSYWECLGCLLGKGKFSISLKTIIVFLNMFIHKNGIIGFNVFLFTIEFHVPGCLFFVHILK